MNNGTLYLGDCLEIFPRLTRGSIDLLYFDPPFMTGRSRRGTTASFTFDDQWEGQLRTFLPWLQERLERAVPLISSHGSLIVHLDYRTIHYVKVLLDTLLGSRTFMNEIIWHYTGGGRSRSRFSCKHDTLLWYAPHGKPFFNPDPIREPYRKTSGYARSGIKAASGKRYMPHSQGTPPDDVWDIPIINPMSKERVGWPTQKPLSLMERLVLALTAPRGLVGDFMCGSGTTLLAAALKDRQWVGGDRSAAALSCAEERLRAHSGAPISIQKIECDKMGCGEFHAQEEENNV